MSSTLAAETYSSASSSTRGRAPPTRSASSASGSRPSSGSRPPSAPAGRPATSCATARWVEALLAGRPQPEGTMDVERFPHVADDFPRMTEVGVDVRREHAQADVCARARRARRRAARPDHGERPARPRHRGDGPLGTTGAAPEMLRTRTFDTWTHEQDIRRAAGLPANLASPARRSPRCRWPELAGFMLARNVEAPPGTMLHVSVTGAVEFERWAEVDDDGRGRELDAPVGDASATVSLRTDWETYARLGTGRLDPAAPATCGGGDARWRCRAGRPPARGARDHSLNCGGQLPAQRADIPCGGACRREVRA